MLSIGWFDLERFNYPHGNVADNEEGHELPPGLFSTKFLCVWATPKPINYTRGLENHLNHLSKTWRQKESDPSNIHYPHFDSCRATKRISSKVENGKSELGFNKKKTCVWGTRGKFWEWEYNLENLRTNLFSFRIQSEFGYEENTVKENSPARTRIWGIENLGTSSSG